MDSIATKFKGTETPCVEAHVKNQTHRTILLKQGREHISQFDLACEVPSETIQAQVVCLGEEMSDRPNNTSCVLFHLKQLKHRLSPSRNSMSDRSNTSSFSFAFSSSQNRLEQYPELFK